MSTGRRGIILANYLVKYSKIFDSSTFLSTDKVSSVLSNGTFTGFQGLINRSEIDITVQPFTINIQKSETSDFAFPFKLYHYTFMTRKCTPQIFDIFHNFSRSIWIAIILLVMLAIYYVTLKCKYSIDKIFTLHFRNIFEARFGFKAFFSSRKFVRLFLVYRGDVSWTVL